LRKNEVFKVEEEKDKSWSLDSGESYHGGGGNESSESASMVGALSFLLSPSKAHSMFKAQIQS
jgi:hypothetical protein